MHIESLHSVIDQPTRLTQYSCSEIPALNSVEYEHEPPPAFRPRPDGGDGWFSGQPRLLGPDLVARPLIAVSGAIIYVIWVSRFKDKFENETNRSVTSFQSFQRSFDGSRGAHGSVKPIPPASDPLNPEEAG